MGNPDVAHTSQTMTFPMPAADVTVEAMYESAENARETELLGSAAMIGAVGISAVVLAYQAHQLGTELYLKYLLPSGAALPQNRIQLAEMLWKNAGEPVPDVNAMYEDIGLNEEAAQQAAQWALENELMELPDEEHTEQFKPDEQISYGEAIRAWKKAQQLKTAEENSKKRNRSIRQRWNDSAFSFYYPGRNSSVPRAASTGWNRQPASPAVSATTRNSSARTRTSRASPKRWCPAGTFLRCMVKPPFVSELCAILCRAVPIVCGRKMWYTVTDKSRRNCYADHYTAGYGGHHAPAGPCPDRRAGRMRGPCPAV